MKSRLKFGKLALCATILASSLAAIPVSASSPSVSDDFTAIWSRQQAEKVKLTSENTAPEVDMNFDLVAPDQWVWDTWPLQNRDGSLATIKGYKVAFALVAPRTYGWGERHTHARIGMFYSKNGKDWTYAGVPYNTDKALGHHQWAGTAMLDEKGKVNLFYTAVTDMNANGGKEWNEDNWVLRAEQRIATASFDIVADKEGIRLTNEGEHKIILEADGKYYETIEQFQKHGNIISAFRDPFFFQDPNTGKEYIIFEGQSPNTTVKPENIGDEEYRKTHSVPDRAQYYNGNIGIAEVLDHDVTKLKLLPPLIESVGTNHQLERPHVVVNGDEYYLFTISHTFTYAPGLTGPDGVYGFYGKGGLRADYKPMNESGLVIGNPANNPYQAYSWLVLPNQQVISFINEPRDANGNVQFAGTFNATVKVNLNGDKSEVGKEGKAGEIKPFGANR
ncbi:glycoside hydrolase family 68 protein [Paenibacillus sedimenti]|uniref:Glycoside hydrolase family 68 protein n=1 Tax=Paenibacillus sedimenti TaxID=2770274 RepID=A0A926QHP6_9BACL|nr:glycoside hydrolase family 68 protein [Paenibacillus sedimenti]MBD0378744.1 glycoside hydrolase family 68 protein [Paenibacillus sedimenti]